MQMVVAPSRFLHPRISRTLLETVSVAAACFVWLVILSLAGFFRVGLGFYEWLAPLRLALVRPI